MTRWPTRKINRLKEPSKQPSFFDQVIEEHAVEAVYTHAPSEWRKAAGEALGWVVEHYREFTSQHVLDRLAMFGVHTGDNRAIGYVMRAGQRLGLMEYLRHERTSHRTSHGRSKAVYKSLKFKEQL